MNIFKKVLLVALSAGLLSVPSTIDKVEAANITSGTELFLKPSSDWNLANARFAAYFYNDSTNTWKDMVDSNSDGVYEVSAPTGSWTNVIFCRMNPETTDNSWGNKWNQTGDLTYDGLNNCYTVSGWESGSWGTYTYVEPIWSVAGSNIVGVGSWNAAETATEMTKQEDGSYQIVLEFSAAGEFKVLLNHAWDTAYPSSNYVLKGAGYYTITLKGTTVEATYIDGHLKTYHQESSTKGTVRFIGTFGDVYTNKETTNYDEVGFTFTFGDVSVNKDAGYIYTSVVADGETITAASFYAQYFFCITINNIPEGATLEVTPYARLLNQSVETGATESYTF